MAPTRSLDASLAAIGALALAIGVFLNGDPLYLGLWYYFAVPLVVLGACAGLRTPPFFLFGASLAISISMLAVMSVNWRAERPEGLLGLGHLFSMPGAFIGVLASAFVVRLNVGIRPIGAFIVGFLGLLGGYILNQLVICNTVMWCGPLSLPMK